jgi:selenium metabolism protein YedF
MSENVDARGLACPQPVVLTKKALEKADEVFVIVDNETAKQNVSRLADSRGFQVSVEKKGEATYLHLTRKVSGLEKSSVTPATKSDVLLISSNTMGRGDDVLGNTLMRSFMHTLTEAETRPSRIIFMNSGVKLVARDSEVIDDLRALEKQGIEILACGTCLGYYNLKEAVEVGRVSNMYDITAALLDTDKIISL